MRTFLNAVHPIDEDLLEAYLADWKPYALPRKTPLTREGETERYMYYVLEGFQKSYYLRDNKEHVIAFTYPPSFTGIPESFLSQTPSKCFLETITDSSFMRLTYEQHQHWMHEHRQIETLFRKATEHWLVGMLDRYYELMALDIESRFVSFCKRSPHLLNKVAHKDIASYLRIDATNFSKLMNRVQI